jgi:hypothetical protein
MKTASRQSFVIDMLQGKQAFPEAVTDTVERVMSEK